MSTNNNQWSNREKLSALLQLKRHEQPPAEFWNKFERDLEEKRLQALVKPSWSGWLGKVWNEHRSWAVPASAAPVLIITAAYLFFFPANDETTTVAGISWSGEASERSLENMTIEDPLTGEPLSFVFEGFSTEEFSLSANESSVSFVADTLAKGEPSSEAKGFRTELAQDILEKESSRGYHQVALVSFSRELSSAPHTSAVSQMSF